MQVNSLPKQCLWVATLCKGRGGIDPKLIPDVFQLLTEIEFLSQYIMARIVDDQIGYHPKPDALEFDG